MSHRVALMAMSLLSGACSTPAPAPPQLTPTPSRTVLPSEQTIIADVDPSFDSQSIYILNNSSVPVTITSIRLTECANVASACTLIPLRVRIEPSNRSRVFVVRPVDPDRAYSYKYAWTWSAASRQ